VGEQRGRKKNMYWQKVKIKNGYKLGLKRKLGADQGIKTVITDLPIPVAAFSNGYTLLESRNYA
jgi:hypothetical protein